MMRVLLNGINALSAGCRAVVNNVVPCIAEVARDIRFDLVLPAGCGYDHWKSARNLNVHLMSRTNSKILTRFAEIYVKVAQWCRKFQSDVCFTLADIGPVSLKVPHIVLLQQAIIVYRDKSFERLLAPGERNKFLYRRWHFGRMAAHCEAITVQTPVMAERLCRIYDVPLEKIWVIPNTLPIQVPKDRTLIKPNSQMMEINKPFRFLFLAVGYEHKNHILLPHLVKELRPRGLADVIHIFVTLDPDKSPYERDLYLRLKPYSDCVTNLGKLAPEQVSSAYKAASALFMPTLVESFGLIYLEAMAHGCPILTSDRDFARWMCNDLALYFEPTKPVSVVNVVEQFMSKGIGEDYETRAAKRLAEFPSSWKIVAEQYIDMLRHVFSTTRA